MSPVSVELFAGVMGVTWTAHGRKPLTPRQGSKARFASTPLRALGLDVEPPEVVVANDLSPWGRTWGILDDAEAREEVARRIEAEVPSKARYLELHKHPTPADDIGYAHEHLLLERWSFSGRPVEEVGGCWRAYYGQTVAEGRPASDAFGAVKPQGPSLVARLRDWPPLRIEASREDALSIGPEEFRGLDCRVLLDPPYPGTADYGYDVASWGAFVEWALRWGEVFPTVVTCRDEQPDLMARGWREEIPPRKGKRGTLGVRAGESGVERDGERCYMSPLCKA